MEVNKNLDDAQPRERQEQTKRQSFRKHIYIAISLALAIGAGALVYLYLNRTPPSPIPTSVKESVTFPLYYPSDVPGGYTIDKTSFSSNNQVVIYALSQGGKKKVFISIQAKPSGFNFDDFHKKQILGSKEVLTGAGPAVIGTYGDKLVASILTDKSWILINSSRDTSAKNIEDLSKSLVESKQ